MARSHYDLNKVYHLNLNIKFYKLRLFYIILYVILVNISLYQSKVKFPLGPFKILLHMHLHNNQNTLEHVRINKFNKSKHSYVGVIN